MTSHRSDCPIAGGLDLAGDRWTLLILRDMFLGKRRYSDFLGSAEKITTNILADRLVKMERAGLISKKPYQERPVRHEYRLTPMGRALLPVLQQMSLWAARYVDGAAAPEDTLMSRAIAPSRPIQTA